MVLETELKKLNTHLETLNVNLAALVVSNRNATTSTESTNDGDENNNDAPSTSNSASKPKPKPKTKPKSKPEPKKEEPEDDDDMGLDDDATNDTPGVTEDELRSKLKEAREVAGKPALAKLMKKYKARLFSEIDESDYTRMYSDAAALIEASDDE